jgi:hypothetical protein
VSHLRAAKGGILLPTGGFSVLASKPVKLFKNNKKTRLPLSNISARCGQVGLQLVSAAQKKRALWAATEPNLRGPSDKFAV